MNHTSEANMKKISVANLDKLLDDFSQIEKKILEINGKNSLLDLQLEKCNRLLTLSQSKEESVQEGKLLTCLNSQEYKNQIDKLVTEIKNKEEECKLELTKVHCDMRRKCKFSEFPLMHPQKDPELKALLKIFIHGKKNHNNGNTFFKHLFNAKLARLQNKTTKAYPDTTVLPQNIYRRKLQHLQEEKNKEIEILRNTIRDLEQRLSSGPDSLLKRRRF
uniref:Uncharacterized protein n=1 Tax=Gopherus agassizii TaxID=38772 RepID=A0A452GM24_9SAUR